MYKTIIIFVLVLLTYLAINIYIGWHGLYALSHFSPNISHTVYWGIFFVIAFSYLFGRIKLLPGSIRRFMQLIGSYYFAVMEFAILLLPLADLIAWLAGTAGVPLSTYMPIFITAVLLLLFGLLVWGSWNAWVPIVRTYEIDIDKPAGDLQELRIAVASDLHLGNIVANRHLTRLVERVNDMQPDLVLLPGDVIDDVIEPFMRKEMSKVMRQLQAPFGVYAVPGNHDYYGGHIKEYVKQMDAIGIHVLQDESVLIHNSFYLAGRKDKATETIDPVGRVSVQELLQDLNVTRPIIMMDHQPYHFDKAAAAGVDLLLCGHTHRGQFAPNHWITSRVFELDWGYMLKEKMHVIVSSGFGTWGPPIRLASRCEILELIVRFRS